MRRGKLSVTADDTKGDLAGRMTKRRYVTSWKENVLHRTIFIDSMYFKKVFFQHSFTLYFFISIRFLL